MIQVAMLSMPRLRESLAIQINMTIDDAKKRTLITVVQYKKLFIVEPMPRIESAPPPCCSWERMANGESSFVGFSMGGMVSCETVTLDAAAEFFDECLAIA